MSDRENLSYTMLADVVAHVYELRDCPRVIQNENTRMNQTIAYSKPSIEILGRVAEVIHGTLIKGHRGVVEGIRWRILPAYDLDE